jgi:hypothetical protein
VSEALSCFNSLLQALIDAQERIASTVRDFKFNLGFSGYYYKAGMGAEDAGDEALIGKNYYKI